MDTAASADDIGRGNEAVKKRKNKTSSVIRTSTLMVLFCLMMVGVMYWESRIYPKSLQTTTLDVTDVMPEPQATKPVVPTPPSETDRGLKTLNVLLIGEDQWNLDDHGRSDTIILCAIDSVTDQITMVSFLRDLYVDIPGRSANRLNAAYAYGGITLLKETLKQNFGVDVDVTIEIDFNGYVNMIDYLGGVEIELTAREADYLNRGEIWTPDYANSWYLKEGRNLLSGYQALAYSRIRYLDSDFIRTERQQAVLREIINQFHDLNWSRISAAMECLLQQSRTSMTDQELFLYTIGFYPVLMDGELVNQQIPAEGTWTCRTIKGMSVIDADLEANRLLLDELLPGSG